MNEKIKKLAEKAGFAMWEDEHWNRGDIVDWNCRYDEELEKFAKLIAEECASMAAQSILDEFNVDNSRNQK